MISLSILQGRFAFYPYGFAAFLLGFVWYLVKYYNWKNGNQLKNPLISFFNFLDDVGDTLLYRYNEKKFPSLMKEAVVGIVDFFKSVFTGIKKYANDAFYFFRDTAKSVQNSHFQAFFKNKLSGFYAFFSKNIQDIVEVAYNIFNDFILNLVKTWYIVLSLLAISVLLHWTDTGKDVLDFLIDEIAGNFNRGFYINSTYLLFIIIACLIYAFSCWIVPRYDWAKDERGNKKTLEDYESTSAKTVFRSEGVSLFYIFALGIDFSYTDEFGKMTFGFMLMSFLFYLSLAYFAREHKYSDGSERENINGMRKTTYSILAINAFCIIFYNAISSFLHSCFGVNHISLLEFILLLSGIGFWTFTIYWDNAFVFQNDDSNMNTQEIAQKQQKIYIENEAKHKYFYRFLLIANTIAGVLFTFLAKIGRAHV